MLGTITVMGVIVLAAKLGIAIICTVGISSGLNWFNKKGFKKGGVKNDLDFDTTRKHD